MTSTSHFGQVADHGEKLAKLCNANQQKTKEIKTWIDVLNQYQDGKKFDIRNFKPILQQMFENENLSCNTQDLLKDICPKTFLQSLLVSIRTIDGKTDAELQKNLKNSEQGTVGPNYLKY